MKAARQEVADDENCRPRMTAESRADRGRYVMRVTCAPLPSPLMGEGVGGGVGPVLFPPIPTFPRQGGKGYLPTPDKESREGSSWLGLPPSGSPLRPSSRSIRAADGCMFQAAIGDIRRVCKAASKEDDDTRSCTGHMRMPRPWRGGQERSSRPEPRRVRVDWTSTACRIAGAQRWRAPGCGCRWRGGGFCGPEGNLWCTSHSLKMGRYRVV
jgi:hypothetical protein